jgi:hypothetical protein
MNEPFRKLRQAFVANRKPLVWLLVSYIPVGMGAGYLGFWLFHIWAFGFIVAGAYMLTLMFVWARMLMYIRSSE